VGLLVSEASAAQVPEQSDVVEVVEIGLIEAVARADRAHHTDFPGSFKHRQAHG